MERPLYVHDDVCIVTPPVRLRGVNGSSLNFVSSRSRGVHHLGIFVNVKYRKINRRGLVLILNCGIPVYIRLCKMNTISYKTYVFMNHSYMFRLSQGSHHHAVRNDKSFNYLQEISLI